MNIQSEVIKLKANALNLAVAMDNKGYNFSKLAEASGISRSTLSSINNGKECKIPVFVKIAKALDVDPRVIIEQKE